MKLKSVSDKEWLNDVPDELLDTYILHGGESFLPSENELKLMILYPEYFINR